MDYSIMPRSHIHEYRQPHTPLLSAVAMTLQLEVQQS